MFDFPFDGAGLAVWLADFWQSLVAAILGRLTEWLS